MQATKLRQKLFGDSHEVTVKSLDLFTIMYGEVGKQQYTGETEYMNPTLAAYFREGEN